MRFTCSVILQRLSARVSERTLWIRYVVASRRVLRYTVYYSSVNVLLVWLCPCSSLLHVSPQWCSNKVQHYDYYVNSTILGVRKILCNLQNSAVTNIEIRCTYFSKMLLLLNQCYIYYQCYICYDNGVEIVSDKCIQTVSNYYCDLWHL